MHFLKTLIFCTFITVSVTIVNAQENSYQQSIGFKFGVPTAFIYKFLADSSKFGAELGLGFDGLVFVNGIAIYQDHLGSSNFDFYLGAGILIGAGFYGDYSTHRINSLLTQGIEYIPQKTRFTFGAELNQIFGERMYSTRFITPGFALTFRYRLSKKAIED